MDELITFLRAQLNEDERAALAATDGPWIVRQLGRHDQAAVVQDTGQRTPRGLPVGDVVVADADGPKGAANGTHIARWDPARVMREIESKRQLLDQCEYWIERDPLGAGAPDGLAVTTVQLLALPYADRPGFKEGWKDWRP
jgi:hypothetical protein